MEYCSIKAVIRTNENFFNLEYCFTLSEFMSNFDDLKLGRCDLTKLFHFSRLRPISRLNEPPTPESLLSRFELAATVTELLLDVVVAALLLFKSIT